MTTRKQIVEEFSSFADYNTADEVNSFMETWRSKRDGWAHLTVASVHTIYKFFRGDGKKVPYALVVFDINDR